MRRRFAVTIGFEWDSGNREKNKVTHNVDWWECEEVFHNYPFFTTFDREHSAREERHFGLGRTNTNRFLTVVFTLRGKKIGIISARDMNRRERGRYYEEIAKIQE